MSTGRTPTTRTIASKTARLGNGHWPVPFFSFVREFLASWARLPSRARLGLRGLGGWAGEVARFHTGNGIGPFPFLFCGEFLASWARPPSRGRQALQATSLRCGRVARFHTRHIWVTDSWRAGARPPSRGRLGWSRWVVRARSRACAEDTFGRRIPGELALARPAEGGWVGRGGWCGRGRALPHLGQSLFLPRLARFHNGLDDAINGLLGLGAGEVVVVGHDHKGHTLAAAVGGVAGE